VRASARNGVRWQPMLDFSRVNVCFLAGNLEQAGAERQLFYILKTLREQNARVRLLSLTSGDFWEEKLRALGIPVEWVGKSKSRLARLTKIVSVLRRERPQIVQSQHFYVNAYAAAAGRFSGSKIIGAIRSDMQNEIRSDHAVLRKWGLKSCCIVAANSAPAIRTAIEFGIPREKLTLLPNVVDTEEFRPPEHRVSSETFSIASVGRFVPAKRHDRLLSVISRVKERSSRPVKLLVAGDGPLRENVRKQVEARGLVSAVEFLGRRADLPAIYKSVDALAITSDFEGTPNVALEAMACGLPVVSTRVGGISDIIEDGVSGLLAEREDEEALAMHLCNLAADPNLREELGSNARRNVVGRCSLQRLPKYLEDLYASVLAS